ncbi:hypothetical protein CYFUS_001116 [Cystobacter fuscus]|uniref:Uncharacterized protein n=1 Tax=Cystobacter fuscus TaxID=43 RepID=A0A250IWU1_9BACT|nr:hypothetical protein CYFUS_001116 [Cystobacter fuscus]
MKGPVTTIRVDLPTDNLKYKGSFTYFFISAEDGQRWHPWWKTLFSFLLELERQSVGLSQDGVEMEVALMTGKTRQDFLKLLQTAPESEVEGHRTLRSALRRLPLHELDVPVRYFGPDPESRGNE